MPPAAGGEDFLWLCRPRCRLDGNWRRSVSQGIELFACRSDADPRQSKRYVPVHSRSHDQPAPSTPLKFLLVQGSGGIIPPAAGGALLPSLPSLRLGRAGRAESPAHDDAEQAGAGADQQEAVVAVGAYRRAAEDGAQETAALQRKHHQVGV